MTNETNQDRRVILITGAASGLGKLAALDLAQRGQTVFASMRDTASGRQALEHVGALEHDVRIVELDVTSARSVDLAVERVLEESGRIDVLVNNAAVATIGPLEFSSDAESVRIFETNVLGPIRLVRAVLPAMRRQGSGRIVNVSSGSSRTRTGVRLLSLYAASKAALHTLTFELNKELAPLNIRAVLVEGGIGGASKINDQIMERVAGFHREESPYAIAESIARGQMRWMSRALDDGTAAARMIADACLVSEPPVRFPPEAQKPLDWADRLSDQDFLKLCALDDVERVLIRNGLSQSPWAIISDR